MLQVSAGQGKSFIILLLALHHLKHGGYERVFIFAKDEIVHDQLRMIVEEFMPIHLQESVTVENSSEFERYVDEHHAFIFDEGDQFLNDDYAKFGNKGCIVKGLIACTNACTMLTATITRQQ